MQTDIDFFVFYLDMTLESENGRQDALVLESFMARHRSLILTSRIREYGQQFPHAAAIEKWQTNLLAPFFLKHLIHDFGALMESIAYVSDDFDFCRIASGSFATTMLINKTGVRTGIWRTGAEGENGRSQVATASANAREYSNVHAGQQAQ